MKPNEFWNCTYRELFLYVKSNSLQREKQYKKEIILTDAFGNKIIKAFDSKRPKSINLVTDVFSELFKEELNTDKPQSIEEQIKNLRSRE